MHFSDSSVVRSVAQWRSRISALAGTISIGAMLATGATVTPGSPTPTPTPQQSKAGPAAAAVYPGPRPGDNFTFLTLDECRDQTAGNNVYNGDFRGYGFNRFQWCAWAPVLLNVNDINNGKPIGHVSYRVTFLTTAPENDRSFTTQIFFDKVKPYYPFAVDGSNTSVVWRPECSLDAFNGTCTFTPPVTTSQTLNYLETHPLGITMRSDQSVSGTNPLAIMQGVLRMTQTWSSTAAVIPDTTTIQRVSQGIRCDSANISEPNKVNGSPACVFSWVKPVLNLNINDANINESAGHIREAQQRPQDMEPKAPVGETKTIPNELTRHWDQLLNDDQRDASRAACNAAYGPNPPGSGLDCDEFPMASTLEGSLAPPAPNYDFSVRRIYGLDNQRAGSWTGAWYKKDRLLPGDKFTVNIFDGPVVTQEDPPPTEAPQGNR